MKPESITLHGIRLSSESHTLITGQPGTGKTRAIMRPLIRSYLTRHAECPVRKRGMLLLDPKGDMTEWVRKLLKEIGRRDDMVVLGEEGTSFNLFQQFPLSAAQAAARITRLGYAVGCSTGGKDEGSFWLLQQQQLLEALIEVAIVNQPDRPIRIQDLCDLRFKLLPRLKKEYDSVSTRYAFHRISEEARGVLRDFGRLPDETRECVLAVVSNGLNSFRQPPLRDLMNPTEARPNFDLTGIIDRGQCVVVSCLDRSFGNGTLPLLMAVKEAFGDLILSRKNIQREMETGVWTNINQDREILYVADECHKLMTRGDGGGELDFLDLCREFGCRALLATQSISALESVMGSKAAERLVALFGHHFFLNNIDPSTAAWADRMFGANKDRSPAPLLLGAPRRNQRIDWEGPSTLADLKTGEFLLRTRAGGHYRKKVRLPEADL